MRFYRLVFALLDCVLAHHPFTICFVSYSTDVNEFYVDDLRDKNGLTQPSNFPAISLVIANIFNGVNGGLSLSTAILAGKLIRNTYNEMSRSGYYFFVSTVIEAVITSGVLHSVAHRLFGTTLDGNAYVGKFDVLCLSLITCASTSSLILVFRFVLQNSSLILDIRST